MYKYRVLQNKENKKEEKICNFSNIIAKGRVNFEIKKASNLRNLKQAQEKLIPGKIWKEVSCLSYMSFLLTKLKKGDN